MGPGGATGTEERAYGSIAESPFVADAPTSLALACGAADPRFSVTQQPRAQVCAPMIGGQPPP